MTVLATLSAVAPFRRFLFAVSAIGKLDGKDFVVNKLGLELVDPAAQDKSGVDVQFFLHVLIVEALAAERCSTGCAVPGREPCAVAATKS